MNWIEANQIHDAAFNIFRKSGVSAVFDFEIEQGIKQYEYCKLCETKSPVIEVTEKPYDHTFCLVCGQSIKCQK
jgi:hypothetical protein